MSISKKLIVTLRDDLATPSEKMYIYKNDVGIDIIIELKQFLYNIDNKGSRNNVANATAYFKKPSGEIVQYKDVIKIINGDKLRFSFNQETILDMQEIGEYELQFRLFDKVGNRITIPSYHFYIKKPLVENGTVGSSGVGSSSVVGDNEIPIFNIENGYIKTEWKNGDVILGKNLNKVEVQLEGLTKVVRDIRNTDYVIRSEIPTKTSQFVNDSGYLTEHQDVSHLATKEELEDYARKDEMPINVSQFINDSGYLTEHQDISGKVDKRNGYSLIKNEEIDRLATLKNYDDSEVKETLTVIKEDIEDLKNAEIDLSDYATLSDLENYVEISDLDNYVGNSSHSHSNMAVLDTITSELTTKWNKAIPFEDSAVGNANSWLTNGYTKTSTSTSNLPSVCTGSDKWGVLFFLAENSTNRTGTQMYFPIDGTYKGRIFTRSVTNGTAFSLWFLLSTFDGNYNNLTNKPASLPANGGNASTIGGYSLWVGTQAQYNAIATKSDTTVYIIKEE